MPVEIYLFYLILPIFKKGNRSLVSNYHLRLIIFILQIYFQRLWLKKVKNYSLLWKHYNTSIIRFLWSSITNLITIKYHILNSFKCHHLHHMLLILIFRKPFLISFTNWLWKFVFIMSLLFVYHSKSNLLNLKILHRLLNF